MHGMPSTRAHTATNFARVGGRICVIRGQSNRAYYMLYPDAAPFCFRVGTSNACNWQIYAEGVAARHFDLLWDGFALWAEPLHGSTPIRLNGATHRHRVRIAGDTRLSVGDAFIDILVGTEPAQPDRAEPKPERTAQPPRPRDSQFHIARPPQPVDGDRVHLRTAVGVPVDAARMAQNELDAIRRAALALAHTGHLESGRARRSHTQPIFAISPSEPERPLSEPPRSLFPVGALDSEQPIPAVAEHCAFPGEDVPYARSEPPRASGIAPRVFSDAPPANAAPYAHAGPREPVTWQRSALECTLRGAPANQQGPATRPMMRVPAALLAAAPALPTEAVEAAEPSRVVRAPQPPKPPRPARTPTVVPPAPVVPSPRPAAGPRPLRPPLSVPAGPRAFSVPNMPMPAALFRREVELREHHLREQARQHSTHAPRPASIFDTAPRARPVARRAPPARASARALVLVMAISMCLCPLTQPEVREALRSQGKVALQHPALREGSLRVTRLLRSLAGMPVQVPALPELRQSER